MNDFTNPWMAVQHLDTFPPPFKKPRDKQTPFIRVFESKISHPTDFYLKYLLVTQKPFRFLITVQIMERKRFINEKSNIIPLGFHRNFPRSYLWWGWVCMLQFQFKYCHNIWNSIVWNNFPFSSITSLQKLHIRILSIKFHKASS